MIETPKTLLDSLIQNEFFMVMRTCVRGPTLASLAVVLVLLSIWNIHDLRVITLHGRIILFCEFPQGF